jgi:O-glycosyl hydrolase
MKKSLSLILLIIIAVPILAAETILLDFESATVPTSVTSWLNYSTAGTAATVWSSPNPITSDPINTTAKCYKITKQANDQYWTGLEVTFANTTPITTANQYLHVMVYKTTTSRIALTFTPLGGTQSADVWQTKNTSGAWTDYVLPITSGINLKTIAIKIGDAAGIYYIDQISLSDNPASISRTDITIDPTIKNQIIEGWGGSLCWWANIVGKYSDARIKYICDWIVDPVNGLNMNIFRFNIGGGDDPTHKHMRSDGGDMPGYKASLTAAYDWRQDSAQRKVMQQLIASRIEKAGVNDIQLVAFSNSPPYWMTRSGCSAGSAEGNVSNLKSDMYDDFADYQTEVVKYYHDNLGITFNYIEPFNEPDGGWWKALGNQEGCYFSESDQMVMIRELYAKMLAKNMLAYSQITANDANSLDAGYNALNTYKNAGDIMSKLKLVSVHSYGGSQRSGTAAVAKAYNLKLWQSESGPINIGGTDESIIMIMADRIITDVRDLRCTAWADWQIVGSGTSPLWALIGGQYDVNNAPFSKLASYYIRAQFSRYIKAGYTIIDNSSPNSLAALSPNGNELVVVVDNKETYTQKFKIDLSKFTGIGRVTQIRTRALASLGVKNSVTYLTVVGNSFSYDALSESCATFVIPINQPTAIDEINDKQNLFKVYVEDRKLHIISTNEEKCNISIYNTAGQCVSKFNNQNTPCSLSAKALKGIYIVRTEVNNNAFCQRILIP